MAEPLSAARLSELRDSFESRPTNTVAQNAVSKCGIVEACLSRSVLQRTNTAFSCRITNAKPVTDQKNSGRCWLFAALNAIRIPVIKAHNLEKFELSQTYLYFWDKVERSNFFLETVIGLIERGEDDIDGRVLAHLLTAPVDDGGQWDMMTSLILKHGIVPRSCMPEAHSATLTRQFNALLSRKLRQDVNDLRKLYAEKKSVTALREAKSDMVAAIYRICCISLGTPPSKITWEFTDKSHAYHCHPDLTPVEFYQQLMKPHFDVEKKVCIVHDPRPGHDFHKTYTVQYLGNVVGGRAVKYVNLEIDSFREAIRGSLLTREAVWFGCDVGKCFERKTGFMDLDLFGKEAAFDVDLSMSKSDTLLFGESIPSHAMLLTGFNVTPKSGETVEESNKAGRINKWCVENSWGKEMHDEGYLTMTDDWFGQHVYMAVVDETFLSDAARAVLGTPAHILPPWDPMGTLA